MKRKIVVLVGISASGKSSYARELWLKDPLKTVLVNRDKIRELLFGYTEETVSEYYKRPDLGALEKQITLYEDTLIHEGLNLGKTVICDATHLEKKYLDRYKFWNVPIEYKYFEISVVEAIARDSKRTRKVGEEVIRRQYNNFLNLQREGIPMADFEPITFNNNLNTSPCVIFDIDGTIAEKGDRSPFDWKAVGKDKPIINVVAAIDWLEDAGKPYRPEVIICTGRDAICKPETIQWLEDNKIICDEIYFRPEGDQRADWIVKEEMWREIAKKHFIVAMYDDRNQVTRRARALGLKVFQVEYGNF